ncbi:hypothetical protein CCHR01_19226 [Colletotrichum chrysophilum]|uniref:Uncharacterized protein n=1 Tax=Colletotrichum chrysophilum TaxID=1836956 RepID=A0AAD8ZYM4_9PEZI|nr:hypothetical protein CCHR01_19226 [Colletotrichum chrysophilum]
MRLPRAAATAAPQSLPRIQRPLAIPNTRNPARATTATPTPHSPRPSPTTPPAPLSARPPWRPLRCCRPALLSKQPLNRSSSSTCSETQQHAQQPLNSSSNHTAPPANLPDVIPSPRQSVRNLNSTTLAILRKHASISTTSTTAAYCYHNHHPGSEAPRLAAADSSRPIHTLTSGSAASIQTELLHRRSQTSGTTRATPPGNISHHQPRPTAYLTRYLLQLCLFPVSPL